ncbi:MAG: pyruvate dehydrogenase (acetyl-transferring) E1 component subunit alpha [Acidobacteria bacterium]|nr:pyruvate dehydrogenase (acetyl-transferring) E1 component subunit alpha [Acidobacteriota bacterium]
MSDAILTVLRKDSSADPELEPHLSRQDLLRLYQTMVLNRNMDERMVALQRQGRIGFYIGSVGEEACIIGSAFALKPEDWIFPCYREAGAAFLRGFPLKKFMCQLLGNAGDDVKGRQMPCHYASRELNFVSVSSPVGTQIPQAVGAAWAAKIRGDRVVVLVYLGDGATSEGDFHVAMNFAGVFKVPVVFCCRNNQWAISMPRDKQTAAKTLAVKAEAYGFEGLQVDGNDLLACYRAAHGAVEKARRGEGPTLIEAVTYRQGPHSTSDDPRVYRLESEVEEWRKKDPILRFKKYLEKRKYWAEPEEEELQARVKQEISEALAYAEKFPLPDLSSMFEDVFASVPPHLEEQRQTLLGREAVPVKSAR